MKALADLGTPFEAILLAVQCLEEKDAEIAARDAAAAEKRAKDAERKRNERASTDSPRTVRAVSAVPPIEEIITPGDPPSLANANDVPPFFEKIVSVWNEAAKRCGLTVARPLNAGRKAKLKLRTREHGEDGLLDAIARLSASKFHCGEGSHGWKADIGWLLRSSENVTKALELPPPPSTKTAVDPLDAAERTAALYRKMGRDDDAKEAERRAERLRAASTGPPRAIGEVLRSAHASFG